MLHLQELEKRTKNNKVCRMKETIKISKEISEKEMKAGGKRSKLDRFFLTDK